MNKLKDDINKWIVFSGICSGTTGCVEAANFYDVGQHGDLLFWYISYAATLRCLLIVENLLMIGLLRK